MKTIHLAIKKIINLAVAGFFFLFMSLAPLITQAATGPEGPTGPVEPVGPQEQTGVLAASPESNNLTNTETGANSVNSNDVNADSNNSISNQDNSSVENDASLTLNSGKNDIQSNNSVGSIGSGNINGSVNLINLADSALAPGSSVGAKTIDGSKIDGFQISQNNIPLRVLFPNSSFSLGNSETGSSSLNSNNIDNHNVISFLTDSIVLRRNTIDINANTGENTIASNTSIGQISTGDIGLGVNVINLNNIVDPNLLIEMNIWSILNGLNGDIALPNVITGSNSENINNLDSSSSTTINSVDNSQNINDLNIQTNTGENAVTKNSTVGDIATGTAETKSSISNLNESSPVFYIINVFGKFLGNILTAGKNFLVNQIGGDNITGDADIANNTSNNEIGMANQLTGQSSLNQNNIANGTETNLESTNNNRNVNKVNISANTGKNKLANNTLVQGFTTGSINIISNIINVAASTLGSLKNLKLEVINIFGDWRGNLIDPSIKKSSAATIDSNLAFSKEENHIPGAIKQNEMIKNRRYPQYVDSTPILADIQNNSPIDQNLSPSDNSQSEDLTKNKETSKALPIVLPAGIILALSLSGQMFTRKRKK